MREHHDFCDHCPGCRPILWNFKTGELMPAEAPEMVIVNRIWDHDTSYAQRKAFIEVTLHHSRTPANLVLASQVTGKFEEALNRSEAS